ncbi:cytochrome C [Malaciobacter mytili]|uniref:heme-binding domain-containing protein n=1 Tax=Malaciobacter mytili TaxID=603050 RepID=UPI00100ABBA7|nr:heme-binding domain-containing protein [Malaciobacter mytili]RXI48720.1 cytochrome C [Malaciobacter mytili]
MKRTLLIFLIVFVVMQFIRPTQQNAKTTKELEIVASSEVMQIFQTSCYDCHSNSTTWPWYSQVAPFSWVIASHVENGRTALNFSTWQEYPKEKQEEKLKSIYKKIYASMPLESYTAFHKEAQLSKEQREFIREWTGVRK